MKDFKQAIIAFHNDEDGATATEYIIMLILIACLVIAIVKVFGETIQNKFDDASEDVKTRVDFNGFTGNGALDN